MDVLESGSNIEFSKNFMEKKIKYTLSDNQTFPYYGFQSGDERNAKKSGSYGS